ncbi:hypothetical protein Hanom_Chr16g01415151 [Helianthus anomalus]
MDSYYVLGLSYWRYSLSSVCELIVVVTSLCLEEAVLASFGLVSGNISTSQATPPKISHASAGKTLKQEYIILFMNKKI